MPLKMDESWTVFIQNFNESSQYSMKFFLVLNFQFYWNFVSFCFIYDQNFCFTWISQLPTTIVPPPLAKNTQLKNDLKLIARKFMNFYNRRIFFQQNNRKQQFPLRGPGPRSLPLRHQRRSAWIRGLVLYRCQDALSRSWRVPRSDGPRGVWHRICFVGQPIHPKTVSLGD